MLESLRRKHLNHFSCAALLPEQIAQTLTRTFGNLARGQIVSVAVTMRTAVAQNDPRFVTINQIMSSSVVEFTA